MDTDKILEELTQQRDRVVAALDALKGGRRTSSATGKGRGRMSAAGRRSISERMKARWAKAKRSGKNAL
jgi:DNA invertase Pin-like site-specific DNA recombinase